MPVPEFSRSIYNKPGLEEVICQLKFPKILRISNERPVQFQEGIRQIFPIFEENLPVPPNFPPAMLKMLPDQVLSSGTVFDFVSADQSWKVSLANDFLSLSTTAYTRWEVFLEKFSEPLKVLLQVYQPSFFQRVGLRYRNVIIRSQLNLNGVPWSQLLKPFIANELGNDEIATDVTESRRNFVLRLDQNGNFVSVHHFLARPQDSDEQCFVIDSDFFFNDTLEPYNGVSKLNQLNRYAGNLFRWCITDKLYDAMEPVSVS